MLKGESISQEIIGQKRLKDNVRPEVVIEKVASMFGVPEESIKEKGGRDNTAKKVALYLIKRYSGLSNQEIGELFGGMHYSAVSKSSTRLEQEMAKDKEIATLLKELVSNVKT